MFDFDMSVSADKQRRRQNRRGMSGAVETSTRTCEAEGCGKRGRYRAPKSPDHPEETHWYCKEHVQKSNHSWNYFKAQAEVKMQPGGSETDEETQGKTEEQQRRDRERSAWARLGIEDPEEILGEQGTIGSLAGKIFGRRVTKAEQRALDILDCQREWTRKQIKKQYASYVKDLHPDLNGGTRDDEDRLQEVVWAWNQIKESQNFREG